MSASSAQFSGMIQSIGLQLDLLLREEESRLIREKELLLMVLSGRTGTRQVLNRQIELSRLHSEEFISEFLPLLSSVMV